VYSEELGEDHLSEFLESYEGYFESRVGESVLEELRNS
jgi:hypothetical protein